MQQYGGLSPHQKTPQRELRFPAGGSGLGRVLSKEHNFLRFPEGRSGLDIRVISKEQADQTYKTSYQKGPEYYSSCSPIPAGRSSLHIRIRVLSKENYSNRMRIRPIEYKILIKQKSILNEITTKMYLAKHYPPLWLYSAYQYNLQYWRGRVLFSNGLQ